MTPTHAAATLVQEAMDQGMTTMQMVTTFLRRDEPDFCASVGVHGGTVACPGKPGFVTITRLGDQPVCHHFGLHQMVALIKNGYRPEGARPAPADPPNEAPPLTTKPSDEVPRQASLF
jgi:hypothetical protein